tara:strand:- start:768 stop:899 length:132 start_codon:yes stop_codon:yes gene_type:complete
MVDTKKEENLSESNFGHTKDEWGTSKKKKNSDTTIVAYKLNDE